MVVVGGRGVGGWWWLVVVGGGIDVRFLPLDNLVLVIRVSPEVVCCDIVWSLFAVLASCSSTDMIASGSSASGGVNALC